MPAPAVIPALKVYIKVVAVKKLVVYLLVLYGLAHASTLKYYQFENFFYLNWSEMPDRTLS